MGHIINWISYLVVSDHGVYPPGHGNFELEKDDCIISGSKKDTIFSDKPR